TFIASKRREFVDEFAPFGSDEGADVLVMFEDAIRKERDIDFLVGAYEIVSGWMERDVSTPDAT
ncbi:hypothetical protein ACW7EJ_18470, partial [Acinetobacter soli]